MRPSYTPISPSRLDSSKELRSACQLHDFLVEHQTEADGRVNYGKPFSYAWIRAHWRSDGDVLKSPKVRTLERHMALLKKHGMVQVQRIPWGGGMKVRVVGSVKWKPQEPTQAQLSLFPPAEIVLITSIKPVENLSKQNSYTAKNGGMERSLNRQIWRFKEVKKQTKEKYRRKACPSARGSPMQQLTENCSG